MGIRKGSVLGPVSGKIGNVIIRQRYGKEVVYHKPDSINISYSEKAVAGRAKFANTIKLARLINSDPLLSSVWKNAKLKGANTYQKIIQFNSPYISPQGITGKTVLTPPGISLQRFSLIIDEDYLQLEAELQEPINYNSAISYLLISNGNNPESINFFVFSHEIQQNGQTLDSKFKLPQKREEVIPPHGKSILISAFLFLDKEEKIVTYSSSFSFELENQK